MAVIERFKKFYEDVLESESVPESIFEKYSEIAPKVLINLWKEDGFAGYMDGFIWTINPDEYSQLATKWVDIQEDKPIIPFLRSAFGDIMIWYDGWARLIDVRHQDLIPIYQDIETMFNYFFVSDDYARGEMNAKYFPKALKKLGPIKSDECYGFVPILALGGNEKVDNLQIVKLKEHLEILTQAFI